MVLHDHVYVSTADAHRAFVVGNQVVNVAPKLPPFVGEGVVAEAFVAQYKTAHVVAQRFGGVEWAVYVDVKLAHGVVGGQQAHRASHFFAARARDYVYGSRHRAAPVQSSRRAAYYFDAANV